MSVIFSISHQILPSPMALLVLEASAFMVAVIFWKPFIRIQSWLQIQLFAVMEDNHEDEH